MVVGGVRKGTVGHLALTGVIHVLNWILGIVADRHVAVVEGMIMVVVAGILATNLQMKLSNFVVVCKAFILWEQR